MPKVNITFFIANVVLNILLFSSFFQKSCNFLRKRQKTVSGALSLLKGRKHMTMNMNTVEPL